MSNGQLISPNKGQAKVNLDHLIISVSPRRGDPIDYALNEFINEQGHRAKVRIVAHYDYDMFRKMLFGSVNIDEYATLYPSNPNFVQIRDQGSFHRCLIQVQKGEPLLLRHPMYGLPYLELSTVPEPRRTPGKPGGRARRTPKREDVSPPTTPTRRRPTDNPDGRPKVPTDDPTDEPDEPAGGPPIEIPGEPGPPAPTDDDDDDFYIEEPTLMDQVLPIDEEAVIAENWKRACVFFNCSVDAERVFVPGIRIGLFPYQAYAIWRIFKQVAEDRIPSFIIADAPGLGKTGMAITVVVIFAMLHAKHVEVKNERSSTGNQPRAHLNLGVNGVCPSQKDGEIQCTCISSGLSYQLIQRIGDFPSLICAPPNLIIQWAGEADKWIDRGPQSPARDIEVFVDYRARHSFQPLGYNNVQDIKGVLDDDGNSLTPRIGSSKNIVIMSRNGCPNFQQRFVETITVETTTNPGAKRRRRKTLKVNRLACGFIFFDEYHKYKGNKGQITQPFEMLAAVRSRVPTVMAIGLSAEAMKDPEQWRPFVQHKFDSTNSGPIPGLRRIGDLDRVSSLFNTALGDFGKVGLDETGTKQQTERQEQLRELMRQFVYQMVLSRKRTTTFLGMPIGRPYARMMLKRMAMFDAAHESVKVLSSSVNAYLQDTYQEELNTWITNGRQGDKPDRRRIRNTLLNNPARNGEYSIISRSSCFPYIATLSVQQLINRSYLLVEDFQTLATSISQNLHPSRLTNPDIRAVDNLLGQSEFSSHLTELRTQSPKILFVEDYIRTLIRILKSDPDSPENAEYGVPPPDGTNARHALIFSREPISAFLTLATLWNTFREQIRGGEVVFLYAHSGISPAIRSEYTAFMQESCEDFNRVKVLISTAEIFGEGHNLQRVNSVILTEVPSSYQKQIQVFGRSDRQGQTMSVFLMQLYDERNPAERRTFRNNRNRRRLLNPDAVVEGDDSDGETI